MSNPEHPELAARITIVVDVHKEREAGMSDELPYDYLVVRSAVPVMSQAFIEPGIFSVVSEGIFDDADPDSLLVTAVTDGMSELAPVVINEFDLADELRRHYPRDKRCGGCDATWGNPGKIWTPLFTDFRAHQAAVVAQWLNGGSQ